MDKYKKVTKQDWNLLKKVFPETCKSNFNKEIYKDWIIVKIKTFKNQKDYSFIIFNQTSLFSYYILFIYVPEKDRKIKTPELENKISQMLIDSCYIYCTDNYKPKRKITINCHIRYPNITSLKFFLKQGFKVIDLCMYPNGTPGYELSKEFYL